MKSQRTILAPAGRVDRCESAKTTVNLSNDRYEQGSAEEYGE
jgi:hypothetical protein